MDVEPVIAMCIVAIGVVLGAVALLHRTHRSRILGAISVACIVIPVLTMMAIAGGSPPLEALAYFALFTIPGIIAIILKPPPLIRRGHCTTCGYNLTGNVSGKCSECGTPVPAP